ncbi:MAG: transporter [Parahaliea sp.]
MPHLLQRNSRSVPACCLLAALQLLPLPLAAQQAAPVEQPVGEAPEENPTPAVVVSDRGVRGMLTPSGRTIVEAGFTYSHSSSTAVAIEGFTILPALVVGLINVAQVQRDSYIGSLSARHGIGGRWEAELYAPYVYREEATRQRDILDGSSADYISDTDGSGLGDVEASLRYQINGGAGGAPIFIAGVRVKSDTGDGPFDVERGTFYSDDGVRISDVFLEQPTGSGFWGVQPSVTAIYTTAPAVLYGSLSYFWNMERDVGGEQGEIDPGDALGVSFGMGFAINQQLSFSLGYEHNTVFKTKVENDSGLDALFERIQVGSFLLGMSLATSPKRSMNLSVAIGATDAAADVQVTLRVPTTF